MFKLILFFKLTLRSLLVNKKEVLLLLNNKITNITLKVTIKAYKAYK